MRPIACPQRENPAFRRGPFLRERVKFELAVLAALSALLVASALLVTAARGLLLLLTGLLSALSALVRVFLLLLTRLVGGIILVLRIRVLVRIGLVYSLHCAPPSKPMRRPP